MCNNDASIQLKYTMCLMDNDNICVKKFTHKNYLTQKYGIYNNTCVGVEAKCDSEM